MTRNLCAPTTPAPTLFILAVMARSRAIYLPVSIYDKAKQLQHKYHMNGKR